MKTKYIILLLSSFLILNSCSKETPSPTIPESEYRFTGKINGNNISFIHGKNGIANASGSTGVSSNGDEYHGETIAFESNNINNAIEIHFVKLLQTPIDCLAKLSVFKLGSFPYGNLKTFSDAKEGIVIEYYDNSGELWSSDNSPGSQSGSAFSVSKLDELLIYDNIYGYIIKANFNCKLYNDSGNSITLTICIKLIQINQFPYPNFTNSSQTGSLGGFA